MTSIDPAVVAELFARGDAARTTSEKGDALEELIVYLFELVPGISNTTRKARNPGGVAEIDVAFWNDGPPDGLRQFDAFILIEAKNWSAKVGYTEIVLFKEKLENRGMSFGILVAASGITGDATSRTAAYNALYSYLSAGRHILILTRAEIEILSSTDELIRLLIRKRLALILSGEIYEDPRTAL
ncbi:restriction endonuclease [Agreia bicolorata]|uniref:Restriction endonuclease type IV Mrr domain-containing protein n=1 Tax=Agreia bicolorata TaxID=110935 RepID=A0ABR5CG97_9MICO|nr:restriction endonuclease [Agreia bicolorata]KJC64652.1 hypothetical protein TZ00_10020 [Agreia bicolorata]